MKALAVVATWVALATILPPPTTTTTPPPSTSTTVTTEVPTTTSSTVATTTTATTLPSSSTTRPPRSSTTATTVPSTTTTEQGFVPPEGVAPAPTTPGAVPLTDAGTGALPFLVFLSIAGLTVTGVTMGVRWWQTRPG